MKKYIKSSRGSLMYEIERQNYSVKFRTPDNYFAHATRTVWYSTTGFNVFVQYKGAFYMIDRTDAHGYITGLAFSPVTAEEAAAAKMERTAQAMSEAQEHEAKTAAAALDYDTETAEAEAREARFTADYAAHLAMQAYTLAAEAGTSNAASIADATAEYAEQAREYARRATETAEQNAAELEEITRNEWQEPGYYTIFADGIEWTNNGPTWYETASDLAQDLATAINRASMPESVSAELVSVQEYQRHELKAYLGEPDDYDVDAIEDEATRWSADGRLIWTAFGDDLAAIAERHELYTYAPAI